MVFHYYYKILNTVPVLYSETWLFIHFIYSSVYLLIPHSEFVLPHHLLW